MTCGNQTSERKSPRHRTHFRPECDGELTAFLCWEVCRNYPETRGTVYIRGVTFETFIAKACGPLPAPRRIAVSTGLGGWSDRTTETGL